MKRIFGQIKILDFIAEAFVKQGFGLYYYKKSFWCAKIEKIKKKVNGKWN